MARYLNNRCTEEVIAFLEAHGFYRSNVIGDDAVYCKIDRQLTCKVTLNKKCIPIGTMQQIKRCSGYSSKEWTKWWNDNGFGE
jgi:hypothetical protein